MIRLVIMVLLLSALTVPAFAARLVYLKDGGVIQALSAWRNKGKVQVLVNRESMVEFNIAELDMKRTFPKHRRPARQNPAVKPLQTVTVAPTEATAVRKTEEKKRLSMPELPKLPQKDLSTLTGKEEGTLRKQKREMAEKLNE